jgi:hypothetical protein
VTAAALLDAARADGVTLHLAAPDRLTLRGDRGAVARWTPLLRPHKAGLLALLSGPPPLTAEDHEAIEEAVAERAAIMEFDGGIPRAEAERRARAAMRVYHALVAMPQGDPGPPRWVALLLPGVETLDGAREAAHWRFGAERVMEVAR